MKRLAKHFYHRRYSAVEFAILDGLTTLPSSLIVTSDDVYEKALKNIQECAELEAYKQRVNVDFKRNPVVCTRFLAFADDSSALAKNSSLPIDETSAQLQALRWIVFMLHKEVDGIKMIDALGTSITYYDGKTQSVKTQEFDGIFTRSNATSSALKTAYDALVVALSDPFKALDFGQTSPIQNLLTTIQAFGALNENVVVNEAALSIYLLAQRIKAFLDRFNPAARVSKKVEKATRLELPEEITQENFVDTLRKIQEHELRQRALIESSQNGETIKTSDLVKFNPKTYQLELVPNFGTLLCNKSIAKVEKAVFDKSVEMARFNQKMTYLTDYVNSATFLAMKKGDSVNEDLSQLFSLLGDVIETKIIDTKIEVLEKHVSALQPYVGDFVSEVAALLDKYYSHLSVDDTLAASYDAVVSQGRTVICKVRNHKQKAPATLIASTVALRNKGKVRKLVDYQDFAFEVPSVACLRENVITAGAPRAVFSGGTAASLSSKYGTALFGDFTAFRRAVAEDACYYVYEYDSIRDILSLSLTASLYTITPALEDISVPVFGTLNKNRAESGLNFKTTLLNVKVARDNTTKALVFDGLNDCDVIDLICSFPSRQVTTADQATLKALYTNRLKTFTCSSVVSPRYQYAPFNKASLFSEPLTAAFSGAGASGLFKSLDQYNISFLLPSKWETDALVDSVLPTFARLSDSYDVKITGLGISFFADWVQRELGTSSKVIGPQCVDGKPIVTITRNGSASCDCEFHIRPLDHLTFGGRAVTRSKDDKSISVSLSYSNPDITALARNHGVCFVQDGKIIGRWDLFKRASFVKSDLTSTENLVVYLKQLLLAALAKVCYEYEFVDLEVVQCEIRDIIRFFTEQYALKDDLSGLAVGFGFTTTRNFGKVLADIATATNDAVDALAAEGDERASKIKAVKTTLVDLCGEANMEAAIPLLNKLFVGSPVDYYCRGVAKAIATGYIEFLEPPTVIDGVADYYYANFFSEHSLRDVDMVLLNYITNVALRGLDVSDNNDPNSTSSKKKSKGEGSGDQCESYRESVDLLSKAGVTLNPSDGESKTLTDKSKTGDAHVNAKNPASSDDGKAVGNRELDVNASTGDDAATAKSKSDQSSKSDDSEGAQTTKPDHE